MTRCLPVIYSTQVPFVLDPKVLNQRLVCAYVMGLSYDRLFSLNYVTMLIPINVCFV